MNHLMDFARYATIGSCAFAAAMPVWAQTAPATAPAANASKDAPVSLDAVTVQAQRREERLQDVPLSVSVLNAEQLEKAGIRNTQDLTSMVPGLKMDMGGNFAQPAIRGITATLGQPGNDANVAIYVDGVYQPEQSGNSFDFADISHIEVLKGPQGTLFGRNATGGAIQIFTRDPESTPTGDFSLGYGTANDLEAKGFVTGPLGGSGLTGSLSFLYNDRDGYNKDIVTGRDWGGVESRLVRGKLQKAIGEDSLWTLAAHYWRRNDHGTGSGQPLDGNTVARRLDPNVLLATRPHDVALSSLPTLDVTSKAVSLRGDIDLGFASLRSITASAKIERDTFSDLDFTPDPVANTAGHSTDENLSQEFVLTSNGNQRLTWSGGLFLYHDDARMDPLVVNDAFSFYVGQETHAYSGFGEANYTFNGRWTGIVGLRYSYEEKERSGGYVPADKHVSRGKKSWTDLTPRLSLRYTLNARSNLYATYTQGFKSGGFDPINFMTDPVDPETVNAYEVGWKYANGNGLTLNAAGFYYDYQDQQVTANTRVNGIDIGVIQNAGKSEIYGMELEANAWLNENWSLVAGLSLLHAEYTDFKNASLLRPTGLGGNVNYTGDVDGNTMIRAPERTLSLAVNYGKSLATGDLYVSLIGYYSDQFFYDPGNRIKQDAYGTLAVNASWAFGNSGWEASVWGRNLTDQDLIQSVFLAENADGVVYAAPRTVGVGLKYSF